MNIVYITFYALGFCMVMWSIGFALPYWWVNRNSSNNQKESETKGGVKA